MRYLWRCSRAWFGLVRSSNAASSRPTSRGGPTLDDVAEQIRATGITANLLSTDYGQPETPTPVSALVRFLEALAERGFSKDELRRLGGTNSADLLGVG